LNGLGFFETWGDFWIGAIQFSMSKSLVILALDIGKGKELIRIL